MIEAPVKIISKCKNKLKHFVTFCPKGKYPPDTQCHHLPLPQISASLRGHYQMEEKSIG